ncbi:alpha/beta hydrolase [Lysobacter rhizosphaerae]
MHEDESVLTRAAPAPDDTVAYGDAADQVADVRHGHGDAGTRPLLVIVHGGFWRPQYGRDQTGPMAAALAAAGWTVAAIGYRRVPGTPQLSVADVAAALSLLPARVRMHRGDVIVVGHSAGGHLALLAATGVVVPSLRGVLGLAPAADLVLAQQLGLGSNAVFDFLGGEARAHPQLDPCQRPAPAVPTRLLHGDADNVVPFEVSASYVSTHREVELQRLASCGHFALIDPLSAAWPSVVRALQGLGAARTG